MKWSLLWELLPSDGVRNVHTHVFRQLRLRPFGT